MSRVAVLKELWFFLRKRKRLWLLPIVMIIMALGLILIFAQSSAVAPFIYTLF
jgi:Family of unknown function (DUF5989)